MSNIKRITSRMDMHIASLHTFFDAFSECSDKDRDFILGLAEAACGDSITELEAMQNKINALNGVIKELCNIISEKQ